MFETVPCNLCGSKGFKVVYPARGDVEKDAGVYSASSNIIATGQIVRCLSCGLVYLNPRPVSKTVISGYSQAVDNAYVAESEGRIATFRAGLKLVERYAQPGKILDVGAAGGFFLKVARDAGWETYGVEPSGWLCEYGNENYHVNIKQGTLDGMNFPADYFDVVTFWDVLEHVPDPLGSLKEAYRILKPGGIILVNFPDIGSILARLSGRRWWFILAVHLYYFTPATLDAMLKEAGFVPVSRSLHFQRLSLGYLIFRLKAYNKFSARILGFFTKVLSLDNVLIPYYAGQVNIVARKK